MSAPLSRFVDAHIHLWDPTHLSYPWLTPPFGDGGVTGNVQAIASTYRLDDYRAETASWPVAGVVHVDAGAAPDQALDETRWLRTQAQNHPDLPMAIVAFTALDALNVEAMLEAQAVDERVRGIRHIANWHADPNLTYTPADLLKDEAWRKGFGLLARCGLSFDLQIYPSQMADAARLAADHPDTSILLNHAGMPVERHADGVAAWRDGMARLADQPNVAVKISGFGIVDHGWTEDSIRPFVRETIDFFGVDRVMFASDVPTDRLFASFDRILTAYDRLTVDFTDDERDRMFAANALRLYRFED